MELDYLTRDGKGNDILKKVKIKEFPLENVEFDCCVCKNHCDNGSRVKKCVSAKFTDWAYFGDRAYICPKCSRLLSLYFYNYSVENGEIHMFNVREIYENIMREHVVPFKFIVTKTQKKHLFYLAEENLSDDVFAIQLETETIFTNRKRMKQLFDFVECLQTLGVTKTTMLDGNLPMNIMLEPFGVRAYQFLKRELASSREIQIPLYCGQKRNIAEEEAKCCLTLTLKM